MYVAALVVSALLVGAVAREAAVVEDIDTLDEVFVFKGLCTLAL